MAKRKKGAGGGGEDSGGGGRVKVYLHAVTNDEDALLIDNGNTSPLQEVKKQSRASEVQFHQNQSVTDMKIIIIRGTPQQIEKAVSLINQKTGSKETISYQAQKFWLQWVQEAFPDLDSRAYFLPPVYFNRVPMTPGSVSGQDVLILKIQHGQSSRSNQPTPHEGVGGSSEQELPRHACVGIHPSLPVDEYQDTQPTLPGQTSQCIQPTPAEESCISNHRTSPGQADQDILSPCGLTGDYIQTKAHGQAGECTFPTPHQQTSQRIELEDAYSDVVQPSVHRPTNVLDSGVRDDAAKQRVLICLQEFSQRNKEVLVGMSQLTFGHYLGEPVYAAATAQLPRPQNIPKTSSKTTQGSYDVLLIHRHYGFVVCEVRAFGDITGKLSMSKEEINNNIRKKLRDAVSLLDKAEAMLSHLVSDIAPGLRITKTIAFPNLTTDQVQQAICQDIPLTEDLCRCLGTSDPADITGLCLCCDQLSDPKTPCDVSSHVLRELGHWWQRRVAVAGPDSHMTDVVYKMLVARFCGPATTVSVPCTCPPRVSVKTLGQAVW